MNTVIINYDIVILFKLNVVVNDCHINLKKKITMSKSVITTLLMCMPMWPRHTNLGIILVSNL